MRIRLPANDWAPRWYQRPLWDYLEGQGKHAVAVCHRRWGKDDVALHRTAVAAHERVGNYWHMLPQANQARKAIWDAINPHSGKKRIDEAFPPEIRKATNNTEMKIEFKCGSIWQVVGSDNFNSLIGSPPIGIVYSEWSVANPKAHGYLRPILAENGGWALFIYTSRGYNHGFSTYEAARKMPGAFAARMPATETDVFSAEQLAAERQAYIDEYGEDAGDALFRQEYHCDFSAANIGAILGASVEKAEKEGRIAQFDYDPQLPVFVSSDIGFHDTATWWYWQPRPDGFQLISYDEDSGLDADEWAPRIKDRYPSYQKIWLPHDAKAKTFATSKSALERFIEHGLPVDIVPMLSISDRINAARFIIKTCRFDREKCKEGLQSLREWSFEYNEDTHSFSKNPRHDWASHGGDGFSYGAIIARKLKITVPKPKPKIEPLITIDQFVEAGTRKQGPKRI